MPFLIPLLPALIGAGGAIAGGVLGNQSNPAATQKQMYGEELSEMQQEFPQFMQGEQALSNFYTPYMSSGSPFLQNIQAASAGQNAKQFSDAAGGVRAAMAPTGFGYGPSGTTAAALGSMGSQAAQGASTNYLQNLLNNEQLKFQAAQGLQGTTSAMRPGQPATVGGPISTSGIPGAIQAAGNALGGINWGNVFGSTPGTSAPTTG